MLFDETLVSQRAHTRPQDLSHPLLQSVTESIQYRLRYLKNQPPQVVTDFLTLHFKNDPVGSLKARCQNLNGVFIGTFFGGETLQELRQVALDCELRLYGGASPRVVPMISMESAQQIFQSIGLIDPVIDRETYTLTFGSVLELMHDLRVLGLSNPMIQRPRTMTRGFLNALEESYPRVNDRIHSTFEVIYLSGWGPKASGRSA